MACHGVLETQLPLTSPAAVTTQTLDWTSSGMLESFHAATYARIVLVRDITIWLYTI